MNSRTFTFACPGCGQHISALPQDSGTRGICPGCNSSLVVPDSPGAHRPPSSQTTGGRRNLLLSLSVAAVIAGIGGTYVFLNRNKPTVPPKGEGSASPAPNAVRASEQKPVEIEPGSVASQQDWARRIGAGNVATIFTGLESGLATNLGALSISYLDPVLQTIYKADGVAAKAIVLLSHGPRTDKSQFTGWITVHRDTVSGAYGNNVPQHRFRDHEFSALGIAMLKLYGQSPQDAQDMMQKLTDSGVLKDGLYQNADPAALEALRQNGPFKRLEAQFK